MRDETEDRGTLWARWLGRRAGALLMPICLATGGGWMLGFTIWQTLGTVFLVYSAILLNEASDD